MKRLVPVAKLVRILFKVIAKQKIKLLQMRSQMGPCDVFSAGVVVTWREITKESQNVMSVVNQGIELLSAQKSRTK